MSTNEQNNERRYTERSSEQTIKNDYKTERYERAVPVQQPGAASPQRRRRSDRYYSQTGGPVPMAEDTAEYLSGIKGNTGRRRNAHQERSREQEEEERFSGSRGKRFLLPALLILVAVLLLLFAVYELVPPVHSAVQNLIGAGAVSTETKEAALITEFKSAADNYYTGSTVQFMLTTDVSVTNVRVLDENGTVLDGFPVRDNPGDTTVAIWNINVLFTSEFSGNVYASVLSSGQWYNSDRFVSLTVVSPTSTPVPTSTPLPSQAPTVTEAAAASALSPAADPVQPETAQPVQTHEAQVITSTAHVSVVKTAEPADTVSASVEDSPTENASVPASPTPEVTKAPTPTPSPTAEPTPVPTPTPYTAQSVSGSDPSEIGLTETVYSGATAQKSYSREIPYVIQSADEYTYSPTGVYTFRGDNFRRNAAFGTVNVTEGRLEQVWEFPMTGLRTDSAGTLYGVGWNNQPAIVKWTKEVREMMDLYDASKQQSAMREVIFNGQDGYVYFVNLTTGEASRASINIGYPMRGSVSVDSSGRPLLSFGQAISKLPNKTGAIGYYLYNLIDSSRLFFINGRQTDTQKQYSTNGAFDGTSLFIHNNGRDAMVVAGENGLVYSVDLNSVFIYKTADDPDVPPSLTMNPKVIYQSALAKNESKARTTIESAIAMYNTYVYAADGYGIIRCIDTNTMQSVWAYDAGDNTDAAMALDQTGSGLDLYTGTTAFARTKKNESVMIRKLDALTGEVLWSYPILCEVDHSNETSGCKASPVIGQNDLSDLVFFTVNRVAEGGARLIALNKASGSVVWQFDMDESVSSPVAVYNDAGNGWIIQADSTGHLYLLDGRTGYLNSTLQVEGRFEASPAVYKDRLVIGTCSKNPKMYCFEIK